MHKSYDRGKRRPPRSSPTHALNLGVFREVRYRSSKKAYNILFTLYESSVLLLLCIKISIMYLKNQSKKILKIFVTLTFTASGLICVIYLLLEKNLGSIGICIIYKILNIVILSQHKPLALSFLIIDARPDGQLRMWRCLFS